MSEDKKLQDLTRKMISTKFRLLDNQALDEKHNWLTNLSFGLLGFYIAMLIQLKIDGQILFPVYSFICCLLIGTSAGLGFQIKLTRKNTKRDRLQFDLYMQNLDQYLRIPTSEIPKEHDVINDHDVFKEMEQQATTYPLKLAKWQVYIFLVALLMTTYYFLDFLYGLGLLPLYELFF